MTSGITPDEQNSGGGVASRNVNVCFDNQTDVPIYRKTFGLVHGIWIRDIVPPEYIAKKQQGYWGSESDGLMTGTEGYAEYYVASRDSQGVVRVTWDNPWGGRNSYDQSAPRGYNISRSGGEGDNASVTFTLTKS